ncbi:hypothetical protein, partial [Parabacteroides goldsteinii]
RAINLRSFPINYTLFVTSSGKNTKKRSYKQLEKQKHIKKSQGIEIQKKVVFLSDSLNRNIVFLCWECKNNQSYG